MKKTAFTEPAPYDVNGQPAAPDKHGPRGGHKAARALLSAVLTIGAAASGAGVGAGAGTALRHHQDAERTQHEAAAAKEQAELAGIIGVEMSTAARRAMNGPARERDVTQKRVGPDAEADITMPTAAGTIQVRVVTEPNQAGLVDLDKVLFYSLTDTSPRPDGSAHVSTVQLTGPEGFSYFQGNRPGDKPGWKASATSYDLTAAGAIVPGSTDILNTAYPEDWGSGGTNYGHKDTAQTTAEAICQRNDRYLDISELVVPTVTT